MVPARRQRIRIGCRERRDEWHRPWISSFAPMSDINSVSYVGAGTLAENLLEQADETRLCRNRSRKRHAAIGKISDEEAEPGRQFKERLQPGC